MNMLSLFPAIPVLMMLGITALALILNILQ